MAYITDTQTHTKHTFINIILITGHPKQTFIKISLHYNNIKTKKKNYFNIYINKLNEEKTKNTVKS